MLDLALSVLCSSLIFVVFKLFSRYQVQTVYAIVVNYIVACGTGILMFSNPGDFTDIYKSSWFLGTLGLGVLFILVFNIMAKSAQINGVGVTSIATKMSLVIPVIFALLVYRERLTAFQVLGIGLALIAVYLSAMKKKQLSVGRSDLWLPLLVFLGSGIIDTTIKYIQDSYLDDTDYPLFSSTVFGAAAISGMCFIAYNSKQRPFKINVKNILGGIALGIPNYFSIYYLLRALDNKHLNSASVFTLNNISIVLFTTLLGILLFRESLSAKNWLGVVLAVVSIVLVALF